MKFSDVDRGRRLVQAIALGGILLVIAGYSLYVSIPLISGPSLVISAETADNGLTTVSGTALRVSYLSLNGLEVPLDESGNFSVERAYPSGYTVLSARAEDRFGRTITKEITFVVPKIPYGESEEE